MLDPYGVQQRERGLSHRYLPNNLFPFCTTVRDNHQQRNGIEAVEGCQGVDRIAQAGVLHQDGRPFALHVGSGAYAYPLLFSGYRYVDHGRLTRDHL
jgi:hypothetical protein